MVEEEWIEKTRTLLNLNFYSSYCKWWMFSVLGSFMGARWDVRFPAARFFLHSKILFAMRFHVCSMYPCAKRAAYLHDFMKIRLDHGIASSEEAWSPFFNIDRSEVFFLACQSFPCIWHRIWLRTPRKSFPIRPPSDMHLYIVSRLFSWKTPTRIMQTRKNFKDSGANIPSCGGGWCTRGRQRQR